jgi:hypothetical protein
VERSSIAQRFLVPTFAALTVLIVSRFAYSNAHQVDSKALYHALALLAGVVQFSSVVLVGLLLYPLTYFRGATGPERLLACSTNLAVWVGVDTYNVSEAFPWGASLYYGVNIGAILFVWMFAQMGVLELACRWGEKRRGIRGRVVTPLPLVPILLFLLVVCFLAREGGAAYFNTLLDGYLLLFRY